jgi:outer membrane protein assembly factor BamC
MMPNFKPRWVLLIALPLFSAGCSTIKSWFPDKERDYQFTTEIPELVVPEDLKAGTLAMVASRPQPAEPAESNEVVDSVAVSDQAPSKPTVEASPEPESERKAAQPSSPAPAPTAGVSTLQVDQPLKQAGRIVARALSRQKLEIVERNLDKGYFYVQFDPNETAVVEENSLFDEIKFLLGDDPSQELEYRVALHEINPQLTEVTVQNSEGKPLATAPANRLLQLITDAINQDVPRDDSQSPER